MVLIIINVVYTKQCYTITQDFLYKIIQQKLGA